MKNYVKYKRPYPPMTSSAGPRQRICPAAYHLWKCTRQFGHAGRHEAGNTRHLIIASWEED